jgi:hypothetical protein
MSIFKGILDKRPVRRDCSNAYLKRSEHALQPSSDRPTERGITMAYLEITLQIDPQDRAAAAGVYNKYKPRFLADVPGATSKDLLVRDEDVQVLHGFDSVADANNYLGSDVFTADVVAELGPLLQAAPEVRVFDVA